MLEHGGRLQAAAARYGIPAGQWLDLSTGINPHGYVPPPIPDAAWARLPQEHDGLEEAAAAYYGTADLIAVAGSQAAIQALPRIRGRSAVCVLSPCYAEHAHAWRGAGHDVRPMAAHEIENRLSGADVLVLANPNNPTGVTFAPEQLRGWHNMLAARGGWLVVDEAFMDATPLSTLIQAQMPAGLIVLRSVGKFFGLAGVRVGFVAAQPTVRNAVRELLGPWTLPGPSRVVARAALQDRAWQAGARARLADSRRRLAALLQEAGLAPTGGCALFQWIRTEQAHALHERLAQQGILTRYFEAPRSLRFGLPGAESEWERLALALQPEYAA